jgi:hypothetical protein
VNKTLILRSEYELHEQTIKLYVKNRIQIETFNSFKEELMAFIRKELENQSIQIEAIIKKDGNAPKKHYTGQEKYSHLVKQFPILEKLREEFGLEANF